MSVSIKYCVYCGARVSENETYCPECGKLVLKVNPQKESLTSLEPVDINRKCLGCGSIISSNVLEQCPVCNTRLAPVPEHIKKAQKRTGIVFTNKKLELEEDLILKDDKWQLKEGRDIFLNSFLIYILAQFLLIIMLTVSVYGQGPINEGIELNIFTLLLGQIPGVIYGSLVIVYIVSKGHKLEKVGISKDKSKIPLAFIIGITGGLVLIGINFLMAYVNQIFVDSGLKIFDLSSYTNKEDKILREADIIWIVLLFILISLAALSTELVFRGVLHNTLKEKFGDELKDKVKTILIVALSYALIYLLFSYPYGLVFFLLNVLVFIILGILYEINNNLLNSLIAMIFYNILLISLIIFL